MSLRKLGRYDIVRVLGKGAMGIVYEGRDPNLDRRVAIKTVKVENLAPEAAAEYEARFRTEARSAARLQHPNIVSVYDSDRHGDIAYLVMEYIEGDDLKQHLDSGDRYSLEQALHMVDDLLSALDYAHRHGVVHRDIKPANLLLEASGRLKLTDFGVARMQDAEATRTQGAMVGTLKYMAPEQVQGQKVDARADLFSVGVVLYQLLTDRRPFDGENEFAIIHQIVGHLPPPPSSVNARLPAAIDAVVERALAKKAGERFATAAEFAAALRAAMRQAEDPTIVPPANPARSRRPATASGTSPGTSPLGNSTVTQELELVYWKDVKDSTDPEDLELFLAKFPAGIYADLARRRLRKLAAGPAPDQTVLSGMASEGQVAPMASEALAAGDAPQGAPANTLPAADAPARAAGVQDDSRTLPLPRSDDGAKPPVDISVAPSLAPPAATESTLPSTVPLGTPAAEPAPAATPPQAHRKPPVALLAGVGAVIVAGVASLFMMARSGDDATAGAPARAASAPLAAASAAPPVAAAQVGASTANAVVPTVAEHPLAPAPRAAAPASRGRHGAAKGQAAMAPTVSQSAGPAPAASAPAPGLPGASQVRDPPRPAPAIARAPASSAVDACKDKTFLLLEFCLAEQCEKPGARNHPLCVKHREEAKLREESRIRN